MRVLLVNDSSAASGGAELMTLALREELRARGHDARLFSTTARYGPQPPLADYTCLGTRSRLRLIRVANPSAYLRLGRVIDEFRPDVVHVRMFMTQLSPAILPLLRSVPSLYHAPWYETICPTGLKLLPDGSPCVDRAGSACLRHGCVSPLAWGPLMIQMGLWRRWRDVFRVVVTNSEAVRQSLAAEDIGPLRVIWNGVAPRPARPPLSGDPVVAYAGRLAREKGVDVLVRAFAKVVRGVPGARLLIAGDGREGSRLRGLVGELGLDSSVVMPGHLSQAEMEKRVAPAWVLAAPSLLAEPFASSAAEAMMRGTAVVASAGGGFLEMVDHERTGLLVPANDVGALAEALARLLGDRETAERMGGAARDRALADFTLATCVDRFLDLYQEIQ